MPPGRNPAFHWATLPSFRDRTRTRAWGVSVRVTTR